MLLAVDIGNTNIHLGLWDGTRWRVSWRARTVADKMPDEYAVLVRNFLASADLGYGAVTGVILASVVPTLTLTWTELVQRMFRAEPLVVSPAIDTVVRLAVDQPEQVGADRIVNAAAVQELYGGGPAIIVDFGTATTFDVLSADGAYLGGAICPGIGVASDALVSRAARLHKVDLVPPPSPVGSNTIHAMQSGLFWGYVALIEGLVARMRTAMPGGEAARVLATGGLAGLFAQHTSVIQQTLPELTLEGLRVLYARNRPGENGKSLQVLLKC